MAKAGRPKIVWTNEQYKVLEGLCSIQATIEEIENVLQIDHKTLYRLCREHYKDEKGRPMDFSQVYKKYSVSGKISLRRMQFKCADAGNATMLIWLGKQYLGQTDKQEIETNVPQDFTFNILPASSKENEKQ